MKSSNDENKGDEKWKENMKVIGMLEAYFIYTEEEKEEKLVGMKQMSFRYIFY
jgi:hypothetical protein